LDEFVSLERRVRCFIAVIEDIVHEALEPLGFEVLEVVVSGSKRSSLVLVRMDRLDEQPVTTTDLERASRVLGLEMDKFDPIQGEYRLELESPGPKRPLTRQRHFERMMGLKAKVKVAGVGGFVGKIVEVTPEAVTLEGDAQERRSFPLAGIVANLAEFPDRHR
jgi:ribosome maturation factor RimP